MGPVAAVAGLGAAAFPVMTFGRGLCAPRGGDERRQAREGQFCVGAVRGNTAAQKWRDFIDGHTRTLYYIRIV